MTDEVMSHTRIWRIYPNGQIKNETHVLFPHGEFLGYDGDVEAWSEHNKVVRFGCAQVVQRGKTLPVVLYQGSVAKTITDAFVKARQTMDGPKTN